MIRAEIENSNSIRYLPALTGLRAGALLLVVADHWVPGVHKYGMVGAGGVSLFFVLSGFLISRILIHSKTLLQQQSAPTGLRHYLAQFVTRRTLRIFPIYFITLLILWIARDTEFNKGWLWFTTYTANMYLVDHTTVYLDHLWSLSVEEQLYLLVPLLIWYWPTRYLPIIGSLFILTSLIFRGVSVLLFPAEIWWPVGYCWLPGCLDGYGIGLLVAWYWYFKPEQSQAFFGSPILLSWLFVGWPTTVLAGLLWQVSGRGAFYSPAMAVCLRFVVSLYGGYLIGYTHWQLGLVGRWLLVNPVSQYIGQISYSVYLFHNLFYNVHLPPSYWSIQLWTAIAHRLHIEPGNAVCRLLFFGVIVLSLSTLFWFSIEKPMLKIARSTNRTGALIAP